MNQHEQITFNFNKKEQKEIKYTENKKSLFDKSIVFLSVYLVTILLSLLAIKINTIFGGMFVFTLFCLTTNNKFIMKMEDYYENRIKNKANR